MASEGRRAQRRFVLFSGSLMVAGMLAACTSGGPAGQSASSAGTELIKKLPASAGDVDRIVWGLPKGEPDTLDPRNATSFSSGQVVANMCEPLLMMDEDRVVHPNLAEYEQVDPTKAVLHIRSDVKFWDGATLTADDVTYSLTRAMKEDSVTRFGFVNVDRVETTGTNEVTVTFKQSDVLFEPGLASAGGRIVQKAFAERVGEGLGTASGGLMCTGPYKLDSWNSGSSLKMTRNDNYWNPDLKPHAKDVEFKFISDATALTQALNSGEIDGAYQIPVSGISTLRTSSAGKIYYGPSTENSQFSVAQPGGALADPKLREALMKVIDREALAKTVFLGAATPQYTVTTPATWPSNERSKYESAYEKYVSARAFDIEGAKKLVDESNYDGKPIVLAIQADDAVSFKIAQLFQQQAKDIGVEVEIRQIQSLAFSQAGYDASYRQGFDLMYSTSFDVRPDPLESLGYSFLPGQDYNYVNYDDPEVTKLLTEARQTIDDDKRADLTLQAQEIYEKTMAYLPLVSTNSVTFLSKDLTGAVTSFAYWTMPQMAYIGSAK